MERLGATFTTNQATALRAHNAHIEADVSGTLNLLSALILSTKDIALDVLKANHLRSGKLNTADCQTFFS